MRERVTTRVREVEPDLGEGYGAQLRQREKFVERGFTKPLVVKSLTDYQLSPQGYSVHYLGPHLDETALQDWWVFIHDIRKVSGRHRHQGGLVLFVIDGYGYTTMNGERYDWKTGDCVMMPLRPQGVEHQHFNLTPDRSAKWLAFVYIPTFDLVAAEMVQTAINEDWAKANGLTSWRNAKIANEQAVALQI